MSSHAVAATVGVSSHKARLQAFITMLCTQARLYEFIVRSFLATCSKPAVGFETRVEADVAGEFFDTRGAQPFL